MNLDAHLNKIRWSVCNRTSVPLSYPITGVALSPIKKDCIVAYVRLPAEVEHLKLAIRTRTLDLLGIDEPDEGYEEDFPIILVNKRYNGRSLSDRIKYSFYRNFRHTAYYGQGIDLTVLSGAKRLIGKNITTKFIQMRKLNTDIKFWAVDRIGIELK